MKQKLTKYKVKVAKTRLSISLQDCMNTIVLGDMDYHPCDSYTLVLFVSLTKTDRLY